MAATLNTPGALFAQLPPPKARGSGADTDRSLWKRCGVYLLDRNTIYAATEREWNRRIAAEVGHNDYRVAWHPGWGCFAIYRRVRPEDRQRLRLPTLDRWMFRFSVRNEFNAPVHIDERVLGFCREDDLMFRQPWRYVRDMAAREAEQAARDEHDDDRELDAFVRDSEEHIHVASGRRILSRVFNDKAPKSPRTGVA